MSVISNYGLWAASSLMFACAVAADAQDTLELQRSADASALRAEVAVARGIFRPGEPIVVRLTLINPTSDVVEVSAPRIDRDDGANVTLPTALVYGDQSSPALSLSLDGDKPTTIPPANEPPAPDDAEPAALRLAPHTSIGVEIDISRLSRQLRYSGAHKLEWRPLNGVIEPASVTFRIEARKLAVLVTDYGKVTFELFYDQAPQNVDNLLDLIRSRFYDGLTMHRIIPGFIVQGGSPDGSGGGTRPDGRTVPGELHNAPFEPGSLAMARKPTDPDSASCQFFISLARRADLDGQYSIVGQARDDESLLTLRQIAELPTDENGRPLRPVVIRSFTLIDAP